MGKRLDPEYRLGPDGTKLCRICAERKAAVDFFPKEGAVDGLTSACRACISVRGKTYYKRTADQQRAGARAWYQANKERRKAYYDRTREHHNEVRRVHRQQNPEIYQRHARTKALRDPLISRKRTLRKRGLTLESFDALLASQNGVCAICDGPPNGKDALYHIDHNHETGLVRGLLCNECNQGIGKLRESPAILRRAISYLTRP